MAGFWKCFVRDQWWWLVWWLVGWHLYCQLVLPRLPDWVAILSYALAVSYIAYKWGRLVERKAGYARVLELRADAEREIAELRRMSAVMDEALVALRADGPVGAVRVFERDAQARRAN